MEFLNSSQKYKSKKRKRKIFIIKGEKTSIVSEK